MIVSASRRTDIPAFYSEWLLNRLREGYVLVSHPRRSGHYSRVVFNPKVVDCIVFWTKNPLPMLGKLMDIEDMGYPFYFQFTLTSYDSKIECGLPPKRELLKTFQKLSEQIGANRVVWRYDPLILSNTLDVSYHLRSFEQMAAILKGKTNRCIFSFLDFYPKVRTAMKGISPMKFDISSIKQIAEGFSAIAQRYGITLSTCSEPVDLSQYGISHASCIDQSMIENTIGCKIKAKKDPNQRLACGCIESVDIGTYDSCMHGCVYCYADSGRSMATLNMARHNPASPILIGEVEKAAIITERDVKSLKDFQLRFI
ncbi:DUF1848 domain-containing protein [Tissierella sp. MSJ-40]|uniref:DUF1848 domain-containing protein n=1 Tax=Tissierella simiarum TaxID=2841534 RepID=A0ABS6EC17_9FIRM|nr:DUF1848 domain-containing protein [Tissierella simiarum]MBU5440322.1 DUF1848 domain-containing protein [Tissierella simiarum]